MATTNYTKLFVYHRVRAVHFNLLRGCCCCKRQPTKRRKNVQRIASMINESIPTMRALQQFSKIKEEKEKTPQNLNTKRLLDSV